MLDEAHRNGSGNPAPLNGGVDRSPDTSAPASAAAAASNGNGSIPEVFTRELANTVQQLNGVGYAVRVSTEDVWRHSGTDIRQQTVLAEQHPEAKGVILELRRKLISLLAQMRLGQNTDGLGVKTA